MNTTQPTTVTEAANEQTAPMDRRLVWIMAVACGVSVANLYYMQAILVDIGRTFHTSINQMGIVATLGQIGFACGLLLIVPLGDSYSKRTLIVGLLVAVTVALMGIALAPTLLLLLIASFAVGITTIVPQVIVPFAATLAGEQERGRVVGTVMSGFIDLHM